jgi:glycosyltransferase involved in cell wall biosynthesis
VSVIVPAYNAASTLTDTLLSVRSQTFPDFEVIVVDDGSTDDTNLLAGSCAEADYRIRVVTRPNAGAGAARNTAMKQARGQVFALLDSDDLWMPTYLADQLALFAERPDVDVVTVNAINLGGDRSEQPLWPAGPAGTDLTLLDIIEREDAVCIMSMFRRRVYDTIGGFAERFKGDDDRLLFKGNEDYHFWIRAARAGFRIVANYTPGCYYRRRPGSLSADEGQMLTGIIAVLKEAQAMCDGLPAETAAIRRQIARFERELARCELRRSLSQRWPVALAWALRLRQALRPGRRVSRSETA